MKIVLYLIFMHLSLGNAILCPGGGRKCKDTATCCQLPDETWGCCPLKDAVCCPDKIHCCPSGNKCAGDECLQLSSNVSVSFENNNEYEYNSICLGSKFSCPDDSTCCINTETQIFSCCALPNAVCCADGKSCCPYSYTCDLLNDVCLKKNHQLKLISSEKTSTNHSILNSQHTSNTVYEKLNNVICPGHEYVCPDGATCCQVSEGKYKCCPLPNAVCCEDRVHCCPNGMKCDPSSKACHQGEKSVTWF